MYFIVNDKVCILFAGNPNQLISMAGFIITGKPSALLNGQLTAHSTGHFNVIDC